jgi:hypothetical protein
MYVVGIKKISKFMLGTFTKKAYDGDFFATPCLTSSSTEMSRLLHTTWCLERRRKAKRRAGGWAFRMAKSSRVYIVQYPDVGSGKSLYILTCARLLVISVNVVTITSVLPTVF